MTFSERMGIVEKSTILQRDSMNDDLRNSLWNVLESEIWSGDRFVYSQYGTPDIVPFSKPLWFHFFKRPVDSRPIRGHEIMGKIRKFYFEAPWNRVYDFIEFLVAACNDYKYKRLPRSINFILERELSGYRLIDGRIVPITDQNEIEEVAEAIAESPYSGAREHLRRALQHMSNREAPDHRNSIKESISAVESAAREITGNPKATLGDALKEIEKSCELHKGLKAGFSAIYGYTSDADGIRHGMIEVAEVTSADAKYFLVACAAFINYLVAKNAAST